MAIRLSIFYDIIPNFACLHYIINELVLVDAIIFLCFPSRYGLNHRLCRLPLAFFLKKQKNKKKNKERERIENRLHLDVLAGPSIILKWPTSGLFKSSQTYFSPWICINGKTLLGCICMSL